MKVIEKAERRDKIEETILQLDDEEATPAEGQPGPYNEVLAKERIRKQGDKVRKGEIYDITYHCVVLSIS